MIPQRIQRLDQTLFHRTDGDGTLAGEPARMANIPRGHRVVSKADAIQLLHHHERLHLCIR